AVILSNDAANRHLSRVVVVLLSSNTSRQYPGEALVTLEGKVGKAMADQIMTAEKARLKSQLGRLSKVQQAVAIDARRPKAQRRTAYVSQPLWSLRPSNRHLCRDRGQ
ncbi:MAG: type II toxin-antitoxin system PemK/MazF family toxin, partial [Thiomonas sp.]